MKAISDYTIYCTEAQTKKALELGAPIEKIGISQRDNSRPSYYTDNPKENWECDAYYRPTAEQMIGWLEEQNIYIHIDPCSKITCSWYMSAWGYNEFGYVSRISTCHSRKEATLAAIDAALEYLSNNKE